MSIEGESISGGSFSSVGGGISAPSSPGIGIGSEFSSFSSFSSFETMGLSGGSFNPSTSLSDFAPMASEYISPISLDTSFGLNSLEKTSVPFGISDSLADINLDPDVPKYEIPQAFYAAFAEESAEEVLTAPSYLESTLRLTPSFDTLRTPLAQDYGVEPEMAEIPDEILEVPTFVIPNEVEDRVWESTKFVEDCHVSFDHAQDTRNDNYEISDPVLVEAAEELVSLSEQSPVLSEIVTDSVETSEILQISDQIYPEIAQATIAYESLITAGIEEAQAIEMVETALIQSGVEPEVVAQIMTEAKIKSEEKVMVSKETEAVEIREKKEERQEKKTEYKFVVDEKAKAERLNELKQNIEQAPVLIINGVEMINSIDVGPKMATEAKNPGLVSAILLDFAPDLFLEDGSYRPFVESITKSGIGTKQQIFEKGKKSNDELPPVALATVGKAVKKIDVERVRSSKLDSILKTRNYITYDKPNNN